MPSGDSPRRRRSVLNLIEEADHDCPRTVAVIPARFASTRFPGKPLALIAGKPMVERVWRRCQESRAFAEVLVATDDVRIQPEALKVLAGLFEDEAVRMGTLVRPLGDEEAASPNVVKAVLALNGDALYFSRSLVPHQRDAGASVKRWAHIGLYGYRRDVLHQLATLAPTPLEEAEKLEQLRALEHGIRIRCGQVTWRTVAVDVPEDVARAEEALRQSPRPPGEGWGAGVGSPRLPPATT